MSAVHLALKLVVRLELEKAVQLEWNSAGWKVVNSAA